VLSNTSWFVPSALIVMTDSTSIQERELAVAVGLAKPTRRYELTRYAQQAGEFASVAEYVSTDALREARDILEVCAELSLLVLPITSPEYPSLLRHIDGPPSVLYLQCARGEVNISESCLAVVGRRAASVDMCSRAARLSQELAEAGCTIVSGLALGIDAAAHRGALQASISCPTIAVLAHGLDRIYPPTHQGLARQILDAGGVLMAEYPPGVRPMRHHFLARNRIIAGLSRGVVVVEAGARSGSLVTANFAGDYGRDVFVVEGDSDEESRKGGESLLAQGAILISGAQEVLAEYGIHVGQESSATRDCFWRETTLEAFRKERGFSSGEVLKLELAGHLERLPGQRVRYRDRQ
jgi:DNA protecting protein DprA